MKLLKRIKQWLHPERMFVVLDPNDNSVTLSRALFRDMKERAHDDKARVFVFRVPAHQSFGFMLNPDIDKKTQYCDIQYSSKHKCVGFETLCPSVGRIYYDLHLPVSQVCKLNVQLATTANGSLYYLIIPPEWKA